MLALLTVLTNGLQQGGPLTAERETYPVDFGTYHRELTDGGAGTFYYGQIPLRRLFEFYLKHYAGSYSTESVKRGTESNKKTKTVGNLPENLKFW